VKHLTTYFFRRAGVCTLILSTLGLAGGCSLIEPQVTPVNRDVYRTLPPPQQEVAPRYEGSLFSGENGRNMFFEDRKARAVNDVLTVRVTDVTSATGQADTNTSRTSSATGSLDGLFGFERTLKNNGITPGSALAAQLKAGFDGKGTTTRKNSLSATVTAVVREVFPNGNLFIEGSKEVLINNERQYLTLSGVVRPEDIGPDNSLSSDLIADARLVYAGRGVLSDKQRPGLLGRVVDFVWPF
jgi:flagellar L-ring protein precursor FlgH